MMMTVYYPNVHATSLNTSVQEVEVYGISQSDSVTTLFHPRENFKIELKLATSLNRIKQSPVQTSLKLLQIGCCFRCCGRAQKNRKWIMLKSVGKKTILRCIQLYAFEVQHVKSVLYISSIVLSNVNIYVNFFLIILDNEG